MMMIKHLKNQTLPFKRINPGFFVLLLALLQPIAYRPSFAQEAYQDLQISFTDNLLTVSATNVALETLLSKLSEETGIYIASSSSLEKTVTIEKKDWPLEEAIESLSKGFNHIIVYSGPDKNKASISKVFILKRNKLTPRQASIRNRNLSRIKNYERQIDSLKKRLVNFDENSRRWKIYSSRIKRIEKNIQRLQKR